MKFLYVAIALLALMLGGASAQQNNAQNTDSTGEDSAMVIPVVILVLICLCLCITLWYMRIYGYSVSSGMPVGSTAWMDWKERDRRDFVRYYFGDYYDYYPYYYDYPYYYYDEEEDQGQFPPQQV